MTRRRTASGPPRFTVRARILAAILAVAGVGLAVAGGVTFIIQRDRAASDIDAALLLQVEAARGVIDAGATPIDGADADEPGALPVENSRQALQAILAIVLPPPNGSALGIVDGRAAYIPGVAVPFRLDEIDGFVDRMVRETETGQVRIGTALVDDRELRYVAVPVRVEGADDSGVFVSAIDVDAALDPVHRTFLVYAVVALIAFAGVGLAGWFVAGRLLRPIRTLRETAERITARDAVERIAVEGNDDVSRLTGTINDMLDRLHDGLNNQRELLDDVRHELRTPITIVRGHLELLDADDPDDVRTTRDIAIDEVDRMADLVDDLARFAEVRMAVLHPAELDVAELTHDIAAHADAIPGHRWGVEESADGLIVADRSRVMQALLQFADNAAKYSPEGSEISVGSRRVADRVEFWIRDRGPGVPDEVAERIFERFVQAPGATRGSGLGLAIVVGIARAHGGAVRLDRLDDGSRFVLVLPAEGPGGIPTLRADAPEEER